MEKQEREQTGQHNFELYQQDVLKIDLKHLIKKEKENTNIYFAIYLDDDSSNEISGIKAQEIAFNILEE